MTDGTARLVVALERNAVLADRIVLRERIRALPVASEDGLWVRTQALRLLDRSGARRADLHRRRR